MAMNQTGSVTGCALWGARQNGKTGWCWRRAYKSVANPCGLKRNMEKRTDCFAIELSWNDDRFSFCGNIASCEVKCRYHRTLKADVELSDAERYQTVYANFDGSAAAPTAGLHFTKEILKHLKQRELNWFCNPARGRRNSCKPVKSERMHDHEMHAEFIEVENSLLKN